LKLNKNILPVCFVNEIRERSHNQQAIMKPYQANTIRAMSNPEEKSLFMPSGRLVSECSSHIILTHCPLAVNELVLLLIVLLHLVGGK
jgi:hypothetical protein